MENLNVVRFNSKEEVGEYLTKELMFHRGIGKVKFNIDDDGKVSFTVTARGKSGLGKDVEILLDVSDIYECEGIDSDTKECIYSFTEDQFIRLTEEAMRKKGKFHLIDGKILFVPSEGDQEDLVSELLEHGECMVYRAEATDYDDARDLRATLVDLLEQAMLINEKLGASAVAMDAQGIINDIKSLLEA